MYSLPKLWMGKMLVINIHLANLNGGNICRLFYLKFINDLIIFLYKKIK